MQGISLDVGARSLEVGLREGEAVPVLEDLDVRERPAPDSPRGGEDEQQQRGAERSA